MLLVTLACWAFSLRSGTAPPRCPRTAAVSRIIAQATLPDITVEVTGAPQVRLASAAPSDEKPVLLYLPGIELSGYTIQPQVERLSADFEVRSLTVPTSDRSSFSELLQLVTEEIEAADRAVYVLGESFGGVLALRLATESPSPPKNLRGLVLVNPATSVSRAWPAQLFPLLDAVSSLPEGLSDKTYEALAVPILGATVGNPQRMGARQEDSMLPSPLRDLAAIARTSQNLPLLFQITKALPLPNLALRLRQLVDEAAKIEAAKLRRLKLPVQLLASTDDKILPSEEEARRLARLLPAAQVTLLRDSGHAPLIEPQTDLADLIRSSGLLTRPPPPPPRDWVGDFKPPSAEARANATARLAGIRKAASPVFLSTRADGRRVAGLRGLPPLPGEANRPLGEGPPVLFIGNHQLYGFLDLPLVVEEVLVERGALVRGLAHPSAFGGGARRLNVSESGGVSAAAAAAAPSGGRGAGAAEGAAGFVDFQTFGAVPVGPRALFKLMKRGEPTLLYPGGVREAFKSTKAGEAYKLFWPQNSSDFAPLAARFNATIVPVAAVGAEESFQMLLDADELLKLPLLGERILRGAKDAPVGRPGERFVAPLSVPQPPDRFYFLFGAPISTAEIDHTDEAACAALYQNVQAELEGSLEYLLNKREDDPYRALLPRAAVEASWNWTRQAPSFEL